MKQRLAELRLPKGALPLWAWSLVGLAYYVICFLVLDSLFRTGLRSSWAVVAVGLMAVLLSINAIWNWYFFRRKDLRASVILFYPYLLVALLLAAILVALRIPPTPWFLIYLGYLGYAAWWTNAVYRLNPSSS